MVSHVNCIIVKEGNCEPQDETNLLKIEKVSKENELHDLINVSIDHDYIDGSNGWTWSEYREDVVTYIAGFIVQSVKKKLNCEMCLKQLESTNTKCNLIQIKNRNLYSQDFTVMQRKSGLIFLSKDVITICKLAEQFLREVKNLFLLKNVMNFLIIKARKLILPLNLFSDINVFVDKHVLTNHKFLLINKILKTYFKLRLHHKSKS